MNLLHLLSRLFYDLSVYREIVALRVTQSLLTFFLFYAIAAAAIAGNFGVNWLPRISTGLSEYQQKLIQEISPQATISIENGQLSITNLATPLRLPLPNLPGIDPGSLLLLIDPQASAEQLASSSAWLSLGQYQARLNNPGVETAEVIDYRTEAISGRLTGDQVLNDLAKVIGLIQHNSGWIIAGAAVTIFLGYNLARIFHALIYALLFTLAGSLFNRKYSFTEFFNVTLHTVMVADIINWMIALLYHQSYPIIFSLAFLGVTLLAYFSLIPNQKE